MIFLGIDPGIDRTGFGVIDVDGATQRLIEYGIIHTPKEQSIAERLLLLHTDLCTVLQRHPVVAAAGVEELFFAKNAKTALVVGQARGVILFTLHQYRVTIQELKPAVVKQLVAGSGRADKKEMQKIIQLRFGLAVPPQPDDAADAIALAVAAAAGARYLS